MLTQGEIYHLLWDATEARILRNVRGTSLNQHQVLQSLRAAPEFKNLLRKASIEITHDTHRLAEGVYNLNKLVDEAFIKPQRSFYSPGDIQRYLNQSLSKLCPIFPFC
jgi:hypothetical protein